MVLARLKHRFKGLIEDAFWHYGSSCSSHPLRYVIISIVVVLACSLPFLNIATFKKLMAFVGRVEVQNYRTAVSQFHQDQLPPQVPIAAYVKQFQFNITITTTDKELGLHRSSDLLFGLINKGRIQALMAPLAQMEQVDHVCLRVSRSSTIATWLAFSRSRFHGQLKKWFQGMECLVLSPLTVANVTQRLPVLGDHLCCETTFTDIYTQNREFQGFPIPFKELIFGHPVNDLYGVSTFFSKHDRSVVVVASVFFQEYNQSLDTTNSVTLSMPAMPWAQIILTNELSGFPLAQFSIMAGLGNIRYINMLEEQLRQQGSQLMPADDSSWHQVSYELLEDLGAIELVPLALTYLIVFLYLLFSLAKLKMLRSRWGLAFSAIMTLILSLGMTIGLCASLDLIPVTLSITEIFPYVVIVLGIENVLKITNAVTLAGEQFPISDRIAQGLKQESFMMVQNLVFMLSILSVGLVTNIPAIKEFSAFVSVGLVCNFFLQLVFFTPILYVDIKRVRLLPLHMSIGDSLKISFNLIPHPSGEQPVVPQPAPAQPRVVSQQQQPPPPLSPHRQKSFFYWWERLRVIQRLFMVGFVLYLSYSVYVTFYHQSLGANLAPMESDEPPTDQHEDKVSLKCLTDYEARVGVGYLPWQFSCTQLFPEIFTFYQMNLHGKSLIMLPSTFASVDISMRDIMTVLPGNGPSLFDFGNPLLLLCMAVLLVVAPCSVAYALLWNAHCSEAKEPEVESYLWKGHSYQVEWVVTDGVYVASLCLGGCIRIWDTMENQCKKVIDRSAAFARQLPESEQWRGDPLAKETADTRQPQVWCMDAFMGLLALGCENGTVEIYSLSSASLVARQDDASTGVICVSFSSRKNLAAAHLNGSIDFISINWHRRQGSANSGHSADRQTDNAADADDRLSQQCQYSNEPAFRDAIHIMVTVAGRVVVSGDNGIIKVFDSSDAVCLRSLRLRSGDISVIVPQEATPAILLCGSSDGTIFKFDVYRGKFVGDLCGLAGGIVSIKSNHLYVCALSSLNAVVVWKRDSQQAILTKTLASPVVDIMLLGADILTIIMETRLLLIRLEKAASSPRVGHTQCHSSIESCMPLLPSQICCVDKSSLVVARGAEIEHIKFPKLVNKTE